MLLREAGSACPLWSRTTKHYFRLSQAKEYAPRVKNRLDMESSWCRAVFVMSSRNVTIVSVLCKTVASGNLEQTKVDILQRAEIRFVRTVKFNNRDKFNNRGALSLRAQGRTNSEVARGMLTLGKLSRKLTSHK
jgi:hypothetical protein